MTIDYSMLDMNRIPNHVAIIMDGNGRWAKQQGENRIFGHQNGVDAVRECTEIATELGVKFLTLYAFSTENWLRPKEEVDALMDLLVNTVYSELPTLQKNNIRLLTIGDLEKIPFHCVQLLNKAKEETKSNTKMTLVLALSYSSRWEIIEAVKRILSANARKPISPEEIDEKYFSTFLDTIQIPDPELLIRTSGEYRLSNFLLWQCAYTEFYFTSILWPDFRKKDFIAALHDFQKRERRFGKTSEQITS